MFRFLTAGESHGPCLTAVVEGLPAGLRVDLAKLNGALVRRQQGYGRGGRMRIETDTAEFLSGLRFGETIGDPVTLRIANRDWANWTERMSAHGAPAGPRVTAARPGHADLPGVQKYRRADIRDILERASARETAARVAVGALAAQLLEVCGIRIASQVVQIGSVCAARSSGAGRDPELNCGDVAAAARMKEAIDAARRDGDTLGGTFEVVACGVLPGLGSHIQWDRRLDARLAGALMSVQAIKGVEIGEGFAFADLPGSQAHDEIFVDETGAFCRRTNRAGGIEGGISNGEDIVVRAVMKPIPTLMQPLSSVDVASRAAVRANTERSDVCAVAAASVVGEAMVAIVLAQALLEKFGGDCMADLCASIAQYRMRIEAGQ